MELTVQGKQIDVGDALRTHVTGKIEDITQKYFNHATGATVTFSKEGHGHSQTKVHIAIQVGKNLMINTDCIANDPYGAFDTAAEKAGKRLRRYKKKLRDHHERRDKDPVEESMKARDYVLAAFSEQDNGNEDDVPQGDDPAIIAELTTQIETLAVADAVMRLDLSGDAALMFRNAQHGGLNMLYRRSDGNIGWVDPDGNNS